jgi:hypothetical protein
MTPHLLYLIPQLQVCSHLTGACRNARPGAAPPPPTKPWVLVGIQAKRAPKNGRSTAKKGGSTADTSDSKDAPQRGAGSKAARKLKAKQDASGSAKVEDVKMEEIEGPMGVADAAVPPAENRGVARKPRGRVQAVKVQAVIKKESRSQEFVELMRMEATMVPSIKIPKRR